MVWRGLGLARITACSWLTVRVRCLVRFVRRSSSIRSTVLAPSASTGTASPCDAATLAAAAASMLSFLRRPPRDNSRTRAVAVDGTSVTVSPRLINHWARCRPRPHAFSTAQHRSGKRFAHTSSRRYSGNAASMRIVSIVLLVPAFSAAAVWVDLCGSTPITTVNHVSLFLVG